MRRVACRPIGLQQEHHVLAQSTSFLFGPLPLQCACRRRHNEMHHQLWDGLKSLGLQPFVENDADRLSTVNTIKVRCTAAHGNTLEV